MLLIYMYVCIYLYRYILGVIGLHLVFYTKQDILLILPIVISGFINSIIILLSL